MPKKIVNLLTQNSKIKKSKDKRTFNFGIPAYQAKSGFKTCPNAAACAIGCYATQGAYTFGNVKPVFEARLKATQSANFEALIQSELNSKRVERLRIHDAGDFYSLEYAERWLKIINANPTIEFYAYTKMVLMFKQLKLAGRIPANFILIYSFGGTQDKLIDVNVDRHSRVFTTVKELKAAGYVDTSKNDRNALTANPKVGLVYHGTKSYKNTHWDRVKISA